jgi:Tfp pilus assembly pilus retraction ATPase PilT
MDILATALFVIVIFGVAALMLLEERPGTASHPIRKANRIIEAAKTPEEKPAIETQLKRIYMMAEAPGGMALFSGPTDSGKSSSLTSMIDRMPRNMRKIEVADPVEIYQD